jgi:hypothetical protein
VEKLIILSVVLVSFALPVWQSTGPKSRAALRRVQWLILGFILIWAYMCTRCYPQLVELK